MRDSSEPQEKGQKLQVLQKLGKKSWTDMGKIVWEDVSKEHILSSLTQPVMKLSAPLQVLGEQGGRGFTVVELSPEQ